MSGKVQHHSMRCGRVRSTWCDQGGSLKGNDHTTVNSTHCRCFLVLNCLQTSALFLFQLLNLFPKSRIHFSGRKSPHSSRQGWGTGGKGWCGDTFNDEQVGAPENRRVYGLLSQLIDMGHTYICRLLVNTCICFQ